MITYANHSSDGIWVMLDKKYVGRIIEVPGGFLYLTISGHRGRVFQTVADVKKSLEILN